MIAPEVAYESLKKIFAFLHLSIDERDEYTKAITESVGWMTPFQFEEVCVEIARVMAPGRKPTIGKFIATFNDLEKQGRWPKKEATKCPMCTDGNGVSTRFVRVYFRRKGYDVDVYEGLAPCECNKLAFEDPFTIKWKERFEFVTKEEYEAVKYAPKAEEVAEVMPF